ncbi:MAG TPA: tryptophan synthase subunit alpha [Methanoculleus sp.]|nr:tryptophan synthase subunit alpha [Methanoculleus sp.]
MTPIPTDPFNRAFEHPAFISYIVAGDPSPSASIEMARALIDGGAGIIELGFPFSDPVGDGPVIQRADTRSLHAGFAPGAIFEIAAGIKHHADIPVVIMTYLNPVLAAGIDDFYKRARGAGVDGILIVDMPVEEAGLVAGAARRHDLAQIFLVSTNTSDRRIAAILNASAEINGRTDARGATVQKGFVYLISSPGVTGTRKRIAESAFDLIAKVRTIGEERGIRPALAVGFGIANRRQAQDIISAGADGFVVGSAIVQIIEDYSGDRALLMNRLREFAEEMTGKGT